MTDWVFSGSDYISGVVTVVVNYRDSEELMMTTLAAWGVSLLRLLWLCNVRASHAALLVLSHIWNKYLRGVPKLSTARQWIL